MQLFISFILKSTAIAAVLYGYYLLVLKNRKMNSYNRFYLLAAVALSLALPLMHFQLNTGSAQRSLPIMMLRAITLPDEVAATGPQTTSHYTVSTIGAITYGIATLLLLIVSVYKIGWIYKLKKDSGGTKKEGVLLVYTNSGKAPFSFFNMLFWRDTIDMESGAGAQILRHEMVHIRQHHSLDKLLMQLVVILCWINPVYWLIQKELSQVHEFIADEASLQDSDASSLAAMLLQCHYGQLMPHIINPFFYSSVKRRIIMINQNKKAKYAHVRRFMVLPVLAATAFLSSFTFAGNNRVLNKANHRVLMALDAGHGGNDAGGVSGDIMEKSLTSRICNKMAKLAPEYNIDVLQTRPDDNYVVLDKRAKMANAANAALFISIHVNKASADNPVKSDYEVMVSASNPKIGQCKLLASAVIAGMEQTGIKPAFVEKGIHVLKASNAPAIAIECGMIDNPSQVSMLQDDVKLESFCRTILSGVVAYEIV